jgi:hypothetical protein
MLEPEPIIDIRVEVGLSGKINAYEKGVHALGSNKSNSE